MILWEWLLDIVRDGLAILHGLFEFTGVHAWGWAIIGLTIAIRILLLPLAVKQTRSMKAMQALQPEVERIRKKYKADRDSARKNPEKYKAQKAKQNEELMGLYKERGVNPAASCLPLVLQAPIFFALFRVLNNRDSLLADAPFYVFSPLGEVANAHVWGWILIALMVVTMFLTQRQMMARGAASASPQAAQQKILMYVMPVFLAFVAQNLPIGVLLYWVTTNLWQIIQHGIIAYEVTHEEGGGTEGGGAEGDGGPRKGGSDSQHKAGPTRKSRSTRKRKQQPAPKPKQQPAPKPKQQPAPKPKQQPAPKPKQQPAPKAGPDGRKPSDHLPRRKKR